MGLLLQEARLGRRGTLCLLQLPSPSHPFPSQSKLLLACFPNELESSSRGREDPVGSVSQGQTRGTEMERNTWQSICICWTWEAVKCHLAKESPGGH